MIDGFQRADLCRGNFFIFKILEARLAIWNVSGRDYRFVLQNGLVGRFQ